MFDWLTDLFKSGPVYKHWWRENHDGSYRVVATVYGDGTKEETHDIATVTFNPNIPVQLQHKEMARIVKGMNNHG